MRKWVSQFVGQGLAPAVPNVRCRGRLEQAPTLRPYQFTILQWYAKPKFVTPTTAQDWMILDAEQMKIPFDSTMVHRRGFEFVALAFCASIPDTA